MKILQRIDKKIDLLFKKAGVENEIEMIIIFFMMVLVFGVFLSIAI